MSTVRNMPGKPVAPSEAKRPAREQPALARWSRWVRVLVSVLIVWHLFAVFIGPFSMPPSSELVRTIAFSAPVSWYIRPLYLHHGYHFFAPEPGPSFLVRYRVRGEDGREIIGELPDLNKQWPRLRYHRFKMLADQVQLRVRDESPEERAKAMLRVYARQLLREHNGTEARVEYVVHELLHPADVRDDPSDPTDGMKLDDPRTFRVLATEVQTARDLEIPLTYPHDVTRDAAWSGSGQPLPGSGR